MARVLEILPTRWNEPTWAELLTGVPDATPRDDAFDILSIDLSTVARGRLLLSVGPAALSIDVDFATPEFTPGAFLVLDDVPLLTRVQRAYAAGAPEIMITLFTRGPGHPAAAVRLATSIAEVVEGVLLCHDGLLLGDAETVRPSDALRPAAR